MKVFKYVELGFKVVVGLVLILYGLTWTARYILPLANAEIVMLITGFVLGTVLTAGAQILVGALTSGRDRIVIETPETYKVSVQGEIRE